ncbi:MAG TPA: hypothetical protein VH165_02990 [Kofleriaceae bacterium]|nr:hypothetical protein [Kofleriaceae bacterium]
MPASAKGKKAAADDDSGDDVTSTDDATDTTSDDDAKPTKPKQKARQGGDTEPEVQKQDLNGHDLGTTKKENAFESDRFFVDKTDTAKTEKGTLVQGSLALSLFAYHESGGNLPASTAAAGQSMVPSASPFSREFTDLRLQTDFRHIGGGRWDARIDVRGRLANNPDPVTTGWTPVTDSKIQSGFLGDNELEIREAWLVRNGIQSDVFLGRQFIPDLGGVKIDGVRIDYASSAKFTLLGFGGLYPIRGSRSITDDYTPLLSNPDSTGNRSSAGRFTSAGGFGAAYRTLESYGSFGGVVLAPLSSESPRVFGTSSGYWRYGSKLDFYHFAILDLVGSNAVNAGLTNLSLGVNYKPDQRLRATASFNRVDTDTLNVQAQAFLENPDPANTAVQNEAYFQRIATNEARGSLSAGLGELQRFEVTTALTYRYRGDLTLSAPPGGAVAPTPIPLPAAQSVELYAGVTDRHSYRDFRVGVDSSRTFGVGSATFQRTTALQLRAFTQHELSNGHGEWETEVAYSTTKDDSAGVACADVTTCFGAAQSTIVSIGGTLYYRINRDWFVIGSAFLNRTSVTHFDAMAVQVNDPAATGISGYGRIAYRF